MQRLAVLTGGADAPGMNAAIRAVARAADAAGVATLGVRRGFRGLVEGDMRPLDARAVSGVLATPGTLLGTSDCPEFKTSEGRRRARTQLDLAEADGLVVIGGRGSMHAADVLSRESHLGVVGVPATIDHDVVGTDMSIGLDTAVNTALASIDQIRHSAASAGRLYLVEVAGRTSGWGALLTGVAGGASAVAIPEQPLDVAHLTDAARRAFAIGKRFCLLVVAEGEEPGRVYDLADRLREALDGIPTRVAAIGEVQRGGVPSLADRLLGSTLGDGAVRALLDGEDRVLIGQRCGTVIRTSLSRTWSGVPEPAAELSALLERLSR